ncbi:glycosyltransferase [Demequina sp. NBRC 110052]|uniref:glycosyltransferase n=1 Tax=Demequina sp. NBRC 110052 TaxID=1570341 RepID=UPI000A070B5C|nr:glycosyltransferase [Demequina sp. NBRC 110052]
MRVLIVNDLAREGGAELQTFREAKLLRQRGHVAKVLTFDHGVASVDTDEHTNFPIRRSIPRMGAQQFLPDPTLVMRIRRVVREFQPDLIHVNNMWKTGVSMLRSVGEVPVVQTIRDYATVCPKGTAVDREMRACEGYATNDCVARCGISTFQRIQLLGLRSFNPQRARVVDQFLCPSSALAETATGNGLATRGLPNPFDFDVLVPEEERNTPGDTRDYLFYGNISKRKGIVELLLAWEAFAASRPDARLLLAGGVHEDFASEIDTWLARVPQVEHLGRLDNPAIMALLPTIHCVVVPSLWQENYPNTVLEAQANRTLVIGANRGGIPELIERPEWMFDITVDGELLACLERTWDLTDEEYEGAVAHGYDRVTRDNTPEVFMDRLLGVFDEVLARRAS